jgi:multicomponent K+:H+ antiporter subunit D
MLEMLAPHVVAMPVVLPLAVGSLLLLLEMRRSRWTGTVSVAATLLLCGIAWHLLLLADAGSPQAYLLGNWQAPYGIALVLDRLSALMVALTALVGLGSVVYSLGGDARRGLHFHSLLQFQLMGLTGAFLTSDLFNLFVFFEVLLAASYGLLLHGDHTGRRERLKASVHYVIFNLTGSALFLVAVSLLYALTGTLNMADLAVKLPQLGPENLRLAQAGVLMLLVVFAVKAALLPLYFWLPDTYASATASSAALFAVLTKVGVYGIARVTTLWAGGAFIAPILHTALPVLALATLALAAVGALAAHRLSGLVAYLVVLSAGTLLLAVGLGTEGTVAAALFYLVNSTLIAAAWFLLVDRIGDARGGSDVLGPGSLGGGWGALGVAFFVAAVAVAGLPPLAGFFGKALLLQAAGQTAWAVPTITLVLASSLAVMMALARAGSALFWKVAPPGAPTPPPAAHHAAHKFALVGLLAAAVAVAPGGGWLGQYAQAAAQQLFAPQGYIDAVLKAQPAPAAWDVRKEMRERGDAK